ncbi:MAG: Tim44 domain-containing protein [Desulfobacterales bacterium]|nr:Tim44 domain-containing protein [Desulfobacterales bacterium]
MAEATASGSSSTSSYGCASNSPALACLHNGDHHRHGGVQQKAKKNAEKYIARASAVRREAAASRGAADLAVLKTADPGFTEAGFETMVRTAFSAVQNAWSIQDLSTVKAYISDGVRERFNLQFGIQRAMGYRNRMEGLEVLGVRSPARTSTPVSRPSCRDPRQGYRHRCLPCRWPEAENERNRRFPRDTGPFKETSTLEPLKRGASSGFLPQLRSFT